MGVEDEGRITHVRRVYGKDEQGNDDQDRWVDIEVIDELMTSGSGTVAYTKSNNPFLVRALEILNAQIKGQKIRYIFKADSPADNTQRKTETKTITDPNDKSSSIDVDVTTELMVTLIVEKTEQTYKRRVVFKNGGGNIERKTSARRVFHCDLKSDPEKPPSDPGDYLAAADADHPDKDQYVEVEVVEEQRFRRAEKEIYLDTLFGWLPDNSKLFHDLPAEPASGGNGIDPPWRLDPLQSIVNINWGKKGKPGILLFAFYDIGYANKPVVTIEGGEGYIAGAFQPKQETGFEVAAFIAVNLTKFEVGKTKISLRCSGSGPIGQQIYESKRYDNAINVRIEPGYEGTGRGISTVHEAGGIDYFLAGGEGPRHVDLPTHYEVALTEGGTVHWETVGWVSPTEISMSTNVADIQVYNGWLEHFGQADEESGKVHQPQENYEPLWPTKNTKPGSVLEIPWEQFGNFYVHSANPACKLKIPPPTTGKDGIERKSLYRVKTHGDPITSPTRAQRDVAITSGNSDVSFSYTLDDKWEKDDRYAGAIYDGWKTEDTSQTKIKDSQRVDCNDTGED